MTERTLRRLDPGADASGPSQDFLDSARRRGLLHEIDGRRCVAGHCVEPVTGHRVLFAPFVEPALAESPDSLRSVLARAAGARKPTRVTLRVDPWIELPHPWWLRQTYLCLRVCPPPSREEREAGTPNLEPIDGVRIRQAADDDSPLVRAWLARALVDGHDQFGETADRGRVDAAVDALLASPSRRTLVAVRDGNPVGHATMDVDARDSVLGTRFVELFDILVEQDARHREIVRSLAATCTAHAAELGRPLVGNVVHRHPTGEDHGRHVVARLRDNGWMPLYRYWSADPAAVLSTATRVSGVTRRG
ncbi:hypothetical protein LX15_001853 [Streptoalloteichus tenebrarius]|uniref:N-acetyltransferase domain-containing protein n=1 Tax=Streptoalloteichus tenebrarius (strain ATCC 17920 / DSM 40477 / JCM 4838 / CBS 697.72 / NBRC 16177 / NCIMB 11028 / NRRL B-12390 / A12253. 1 / ISP 5477) TaxID=1933 RepID=A0ABT1HRK8_STRSD|nr:GNAT family N-acetyltransferase [Streptoalloteichus tenebrarius]MCP2258159.1 hypothetical protein [Streptoalloteichus tenebrarius]BFF04614.1 hypothetical protein GCM10020241_62890 [Streptoalloteichus tenebrarius]